MLGENGMKLRIKLIILFLIVVGIGLTCFAIKTTIASGIVSNIIQIWICVAALISAIFIIYSYIQTNLAFVLSQKPHLLLIVLERTNKGTPPAHLTQIHYENKSNNPFYDLNISVKISTQNTTVDLSDIFSPNMYMAVGDKRDWTFDTKKQLLQRGFDIDATVRANKTIILLLEYSFSFNNKKEIIKVQEYIWKKNGWSIK